METPGAKPPVSEFVAMSGGADRPARSPMKLMVIALLGSAGPPETKTLPTPRTSSRAARTWAVLALKGMGSVVTTGKGAWVVRVNEPPVGSPVRVSDLRIVFG